MNTKKFFAGLTALALSTGLVLAGCESPTAGSNGTNGDTYIGSVVLVGPDVTDADLAAAFAESGVRAVYEGNVLLASSVDSVYGEVPASRKLIALGETKVKASETLDVKGTLSIGASAAFDVSQSSTGKIKLNSGGIVDVQGSIELDPANPANSFTGETPAFGTNVKFGPTANADLGDGTAAQVNALFGADVARVASSADLIKATSSLTALSGLTTGKTLVLTGENTLTDALDLSGVTGKIVVSGSGKIIAAANAVTAASSAANIIVEGTLSVTTAALTGKFDIQNGTLEVASGTNSASGTTSTSFVGNSIKAVTLTASTPTLTLPDSVTSIGTVEAKVASASLTAESATQLGTVILSGSSPGLTLTNATGIDTLSVSVAGSITSSTLTTIGTVAAAYATTLPATAVTIGAITGTAVVTLANTDDAATIGSIAQTGAGGIVTGTGDVSVTNSATIGTGASNFGGDVTVGGSLTVNGALTLGEVTLDVAGPALFFDASTGKLLWGSDAVNIVLGNSTVYTMPNVGAGFYGSTDQGASDGDMIITGGTVWRRLVTGSESWLMSSNHTFDNSVFVLTGAIENWAAGTTITLVHGGAIAVADYTSGDTLPAYTEVLQSVGTKTGNNYDDDDGVVITFGDDEGADTGGSIVLKAYPAGQENVSNLAYTLNLAGDGTTPALKFGDGRSTADDTGTNHVQGHFIVNAGTALATFGGVGLPAFVYDVEGEDAISFTVNGSLYTPSNGHIVYEDTDDPAEVVVTIGGSGTFFYANTGNQVFTQAGTVKAVTSSTAHSTQFNGWTNPAITSDATITVSGSH